MKTPVSPKVWAVVIAGVLVTSILANFTLITPDMLSFLGPWRPFVEGVFVTAITAGAGYWKTDPLRQPTKTDTAPLPATVPAPGPTSLPAPAPETPQPEAPVIV